MALERTPSAGFGRMRRGSFNPEFHIRPPSNPESKVRHALKIVRGSEPDDKKSVNGYVMLQELGSGSYGKVRLCLHKESGEYMAMKIMSKAILRKKRDLMPSRSRSNSVNASPIGTPSPSSELMTPNRMPSSALSPSPQISAGELAALNKIKQRLEIEAKSSNSSGKDSPTGIGNGPTSGTSPLSHSRSALAENVLPTPIFRPASLLAAPGSASSSSSSASANASATLSRFSSLSVSSRGSAAASFLLSGDGLESRRPRAPSFSSPSPAPAPDPAPAPAGASSSTDSSTKTESGTLASAATAASTSSSTSGTSTPVQPQSTAATPSKEASSPTSVSLSTPAAPSRLSPSQPSTSHSPHEAHVFAFNTSSRPPPSSISVFNHASAPSAITPISTEPSTPAAVISVSTADNNSSTGSAPPSRPSLGQTSSNSNTVPSTPVITINMNRPPSAALYRSSSYSTVNYHPNADSANPSNASSSTSSSSSTSDKPLLPPLPHINSLTSVVNSSFSSSVSAHNRSQSLADISVVPLPSTTSSSSSSFTFAVFSSTPHAAAAPATNNDSSPLSRPSSLVVGGSRPNLRALTPPSPVAPPAPITPSLRPPSMLATPAPMSPRLAPPSPSAPPPMLNQFVTTALDKVKREIEILQDVVHPNVVSLREVLSDDNDDKLYLVMELCDGGELLSWDSRKRVYRNEVFSPQACASMMQSSESSSSPPARPSRTLGGLPLNFARVFLQQAASALAYLHAAQIVHRDIKPENLLLHASGAVRLADFGVAHKFPPANETPAGVAERCLSDSNGTYNYFSPEQCSGHEFDAYAADVWTLGVTCYVAIYGRLPYFSDHAADLFERIQHATIAYPSQLQGAVGADAARADAEQQQSDPAEDPALVQDFVSQMLNRDVTQRATIQQVLAHPWLSGADALLNVKPFVDAFAAQQKAKRANAIDDDFDYDSD